MINEFINIYLPKRELYCISNCNVVENRVSMIYSFYEVYLFIKKWSKSFTLAHTIKGKTYNQCLHLNQIGLAITLIIMGCKKSKNYVAKETYHPFDNEWEGFTTKSFDEEGSRVTIFKVSLIKFLFILHEIDLGLIF